MYTSVSYSNILHLCLLVRKWKRSFAILPHWAFLHPPIQCVYLFLLSLPSLSAAFSQCLLCLHQLSSFLISFIIFYPSVPPLFHPFIVCLDYLSKQASIGFRMALTSVQDHRLIPRRVTSTRYVHIYSTWSLSLPLLYTPPGLIELSRLG